MNEDRPAENEKPRDQLHTEGEAREELRRERDQERQQAQARLDELVQRSEAAERRVAELEELRRERDQDRQQAQARLDELVQRAEAAETRVAELEAEIGEGIPGRLRGLCEAVRSALQAHWPGTGGR